MTSNGQKDLNDPAIKAAILILTEKELRTQEMGDDPEMAKEKWRCFSFQQEEDDGERQLCLIRVAAVA
ncbi:hypothetical protein AOLI_G00213680 [Acnodon oligacanthus]